MQMGQKMQIMELYDLAVVYQLEGCNETILWLMWRVPPLLLNRCHFPSNSEGALFFLHFLGVAIFPTFLRGCHFLFNSEWQQRMPPSAPICPTSPCWGTLPWPPVLFTSSQSAQARLHRSHTCAVCRQLGVDWRGRGYTLCPDITQHHDIMCARGAECPRHACWEGVISSPFLSGCHFPSMSEKVSFSLHFWVDIIFPPILRRCHLPSFSEGLSFSLHFLVSPRTYKRTEY